MDLPVSRPAALAAPRGRPVHRPGQRAAAGGAGGGRRHGGRDPAGERKAERLTGTFTELASQYIELHARKHNKSWKQADALVAPASPAALGQAQGDRHQPRRRPGGDAPDRRPDRRQQALAAASGDLPWAIRQEILTVNPCKLVDRNPTAARERVLSDAELRLLWPAARSAAAA